MGLVLADRYCIIKEIGRGGTGIIYLAEDLNLGMAVAMKQLMISGQSLESNRNEVDLLKTLHHSNLPQVYNYICVSGQVYTVVEYINGSDLTAYLPQPGMCSQIPEAVLADWLIQLCDVLEYLHTRSTPIIHSDIKPGNIMLTPEGRVMLIDFNIAFLRNQTVKGYSSSYASPEQIAQAQEIRLHSWDGRSYLDARTDIYSLAATFYHLISGREPSAGQRNLHLTQMQLPYHREFLHIIDRAMAYKPSRRFQTARQMRDQLLKWQEKERRGRRVAWQQLVLGGAALAFLTAGTVCLMVGRNQVQLSDYNRAYRQLSEAYQQGELEQVAEQGIRFLEEKRYERLHQRNPERTAEAYALIGESYYWQGQYLLSAEYLHRALECCPKEDYIKRCVVAQLRAGAVQDAEETLAVYGDDLVGETDRIFLQAEIAYQGGENERVFALIEEADNCRDVNILELGALAAQQIGDLETSVQYIQKCYQLTGKASYLRVQGEICYLLSETAERQADRNGWLRTARDCYQQLCDAPAGTEEDRLWYAVLLMKTGNVQQARTQLTEIAGNSTDSFLLCRANLYLTLLCYEENPEREAELRIYCSRAIELYNQLNAQERGKIDSGDLNQLETIGQQYGCAAIKR